MVQSHPGCNPGSPIFGFVLGLCVLKFVFFYVFCDVVNTLFTIFAADLIAVIFVSLSNFIWFMVALNNPLNIRTSTAYTWQGQIGSQKGFCTFDNLVSCRRAGLYLIMRSYRRAGCFTPEKVITRWAPRCENPTHDYITFVCGMCGLKPDTYMHLTNDFASLLSAMEIFEQGVPTSIRRGYFEDARLEYLRIIKLFNIKCYEKQN